jgi:hypothetical protein
VDADTRFPSTAAASCRNETGGTDKERADRACGGSSAWLPRLHAAHEQHAPSLRTGLQMHGRTNMVQANKGFQDKMFQLYTGASLKQVPERHSTQLHVVDSVAGLPSIVCVRACVCSSVCVLSVCIM